MWLRLHHQDRSHRTGSDESLTAVYPPAAPRSHMVTPRPVAAGPAVRLLPRDNPVWITHAPLPFPKAVSHRNV